MSAGAERLRVLQGVLESMERVAVAVSGGVDSMTLAVAAHRHPGVRAEMFHAVSAAVPPEATARVKEFAARDGWTLHLLDAGEFGDETYLSNPVNRCFHCKTHLYAAMAPRTGSVLVSGTNTDDLGDFRPGLRAAEQHGVRHPYVEAGLDKDAVRAVARQLELPEVAELPSAPCLSSRIETGITIQPYLMSLVHEVERELTRRLVPQSVRCRVRATGVVVELDEPTLDALSPGERDEIRTWTADLWRSRGHERRVELRPYRRGSAFLTETRF